MYRLDQPLAAAGAAPDGNAWYAWPSEETDGGWLLTYLDMLSVMLAILVLLLGQMTVQTDAEEEPDQAAANVAALLRPDSPAKAPVTAAPAVALPPSERVATAAGSPGAPIATTKVPAATPIEPTPTESPAEVGGAIDADPIWSSMPLVTAVEALPMAPVTPAPDPDRTGPGSADADIPEWALAGLDAAFADHGATPTTPAETTDRAPVPVETPERSPAGPAPAVAADTGSTAPEVAPPVESVPTPEERLIEAIQRQFDDQVRVVDRSQGISLEIAEAILFDSGRAELHPEAEGVLTRLVETLVAIGDANVAVEGHTDDAPVRGGRYASNWDLAAARANRVTAFLLHEGLSAARLRSVSFGDTRPVADNDTATGRAANRRVNLRIEFL